jgi:hypothetical protein
VDRVVTYLNWNERLNIELRNRGNEDVRRLLEVIDELEAEVESLKADDE